MPELSSLENKITDLFSEKLNLEVPSIETDLFDEVTIDSMALVQLLLALEQDFGIEIPFETLDFENFRSIANIAKFVVNRNGFNGSYTR